MAQRIRWASPALNDVSEILDYLGNDDPAVAEDYSRKFEEMAAKILEWPEMGRIVPEYGRADLRERFVPPYRFLYLIKPTDEIVAVRIYHFTWPLPDAF
jgi:toxin ParE1/3/4